MPRVGGGEDGGPPRQRPRVPTDFAASRGRFCMGRPVPHTKSAGWRVVHARDPPHTRTQRKQSRRIYKKEGKKGLIKDFINI